MSKQRHHFRSITELTC